MQVLRSYEEFGQWASAPLAVSIGFFDGVHLGHQRLISALRQEAAAIGAKSVLLTFSNSPREYHNPNSHWKFLMTPEEKLYALARTGVDAVLMLKYDESICRQTAGMFLGGLRHFGDIRTAVFGYDTSIGNDLVSGKEALSELCRSQGIGFRMVPAYSPRDEVVKSSLLREMIRKGRVREAKALLGHPYFILSTVVRGRGLGQGKLEIPTANQVLRENKLAPLEGIYAGSAAIGGRYLPAAICVSDLARVLSTVVDSGAHSAYEGVSPDAIVVECHILDFSSDIYGEVLRLDFHERIRDWMDFANAEELAARMKEDMDATRQVTSGIKGDWEEMT